MDNAYAMEEGRALSRIPCEAYAYRTLGGDASGGRCVEVGARDEIVCQSGR